MRRTLQEEFDDPMRIISRQLTGEEKQQVDCVKILGEDFFNYIMELVKKDGDNRNLALARTKIEEAVMWAIKGIT